MSFGAFFKQSNSSLTLLDGNVIDSFIEHTRENLVFLDTGLKSKTACFKKEITSCKQTKSLYPPVKVENDLLFTTTEQPSLKVGIENIEIFGEPKVLLPKALEGVRKKKLVWFELMKKWRNSDSSIKGRILNPVNGGYAVAIAGHIAFLPKSLKLTRGVFHSQERVFTILKMNPKIKNIVVKERTKKKPQIRFTRG